MDLRQGQLLSRPRFELAAFLLSLVAYWLCWWTKKGKRVGCHLLPIRPALSGWERLSTPRNRRCLYCRPSEEMLNDRIRNKFLRTAGSNEVAAKIRIALQEDLAWQDRSHATQLFARWGQLLEEAYICQIYSTMPLATGGWAQSLSGETSDCILGLEWFYSKLGKWTTQAIGHELIHVAQEARDGALRREWSRQPISWGIMIEAEAHYHFRLWPYTFLGIAVTLVLFINSSYF
jgi:hypothetical protein